MSKFNHFHTASRPHKDLFVAGDLVLSHMKGYPWWPSLVTNCPTSGVSYNNNGYFVLFLDGKKNETAWLPENDVRKFENFDDYLRKKRKGTRPALFARMRRANRCSKEIIKWTQERRLATSFFLF